MPSAYNLFISYSFSYSDAYDGLITLLEKKPYFSFIDHSSSNFFITSTSVVGNLHT